MISNPVNSTVPIAAEVLQAMGVYDKNRLFGVTTLDVVRIRNELFSYEPAKERIVLIFFVSLPTTPCNPLKYDTGPGWTASFPFERPIDCHLKNHCVNLSGSQDW